MDINLIAAPNFTGYGLTAMNLLASLDNLGHNVALFPPTGVNQLQANPRHHALLAKASQNALFFNPYAPAIRLWHQHSQDFFVGAGEKIGFPIFELDKFTDLEKHHLKWLDKIVVCSDWARNIVMDEIISPELEKCPKRERETTFLEEILINKVHIVPLGVDTDIFRHLSSPRPNTTVFASFGKWEVRKGHDILCEAFNRAFSEVDDVELQLLCHNPFLTPQQNAEWESLFLKSKLGRKIKILPRVELQEDVARLMVATDCGVFPSHSEGWGLECLEIMACGKHVITTDYAGHTEFCTPQNSLLVDTPSTELAYDGIWFKGQGSWAEIGEDQIQQIIAHMRNIHKAKQSNNLGLNLGGLETARQFSWKNSAEKLIQAIQA